MTTDFFLDERGWSPAFAWWRSTRDRRYWFVDTSTHLDGYLGRTDRWATLNAQIAGMAVVDDFGNLIRVDRFQFS